MSDRPIALKVRVAGIPEALRDLRRCVLWRYEWDGKRWTKRPYQPHGTLARSDDPSTWTTFETALAVYRKSSFDGVGFMLGDGWAGIDLDKCVTDYDPATGGLFATTNRVAPYIQALDRIGCVFEISPSGTGYKAIGRSPRIGGEINFKNDPPTFTSWMRPRFFALTGHYQSVSSDPTIDISPLIDAWFPPKVLNTSSTAVGYKLAAEMSDDDLLCQMFGSDNSDPIFALWRGEISAYGRDHSRADLALCCHLAWWTNFDAARVDCLFRRSGLYRHKWDHDSYRRATLGKAMAQRTGIDLNQPESALEPETPAVDWDLDSPGGEI